MHLLLLCFAAIHTPPTPPPTQVKKPAEVSAKFKAFLVQHADTFTINGDTVGLVKK
jgi:hypothetical protein